MRETGNSPSEGDADLPVVDLGRLPLDVLLKSDDSALSNAMARLVRGMERPGENYAAHGTTP